MATTDYDVRMTCETEIGDGKGFHYYRVTQVTTVDDTLVCAAHPVAGKRHFVVESIEEIP